MMELDMIVGTGGVLRHAPRREQSALMMMDAYQPEGVTDAGGGQHLHDAAARRALDGPSRRRRRRCSSATA